MPSRSDEGSLSGRHALITGGSRGIGAAIAQRLAAAGAQITFAYRTNAEAARTTASTIEAAGGKVLSICADVSQAAQVSALYDSAHDRFGPVDVLVNNAGLMGMGLIQQLTAESWDEMFATNVRAMFLCTQNALRDMRAQRWGRIIAIGSAAGVTGGVAQSCYASSKAAVVGLIRSVAREAAPWGITANVVSPGFVDTSVGTQSSNWSKHLARRVPIDRPCTPNEVAALVAYLCSEDAAYLTGENIMLDGGLIMA